MQHSTQEPKVKVWKPKAILVELFGTVTAAKWEDEVAFPYIVDNLEHFFNAHWNEPSLSELIANFKAESIEQRFRFEQDDAPIVADDEDDSIVKSTVVDYIKWQMRKRKESPSTIIVQRKIWQNGMKRGELKMHVFEDVKNAFNLWANEFKIQIYVFSAIDREDIKFLMSKTIEGDLTPVRIPLQ
ncbi:hypothetical protein B4U79_16273 [Dinothrombium tinctorium]|uniref:Uncharacterized protein n=1 Tax=Dinothrombium tinctorium TaxID=1965070 RepID=A0A3S4RME3_9ACAR|nr:hypothetical protein B4U79_17059 [Dinothrombium tinctorium]RWS17680.1 hypothetical protein B4U79_17313 [Dinothrombium tinctorium]RWS17949.1 hypothetical protein B4U79_16273 [Dinothrombium tinctorium]